MRIVLLRPANRSGRSHQWLHKAIGRSGWEAGSLWTRDLVLGGLDDNEEVGVIQFGGQLNPQSGFPAQ
jgi:hypothetical protein